METSPHIQGYTFLRAETMSKLFLPPSEKVSTLKGKNVLPSLGSTFFPFRVDPSPERLRCVGKQTGSHKSSFPSKKVTKTSPCIQSPQI